MTISEARKAYIKEWRLKNKQKCLEANRAWKKRNKEHCQAYFKEWAIKNPDTHSASHSRATDKYRIENKAYYAAYRAKRVAAQLKATPLWANMEAIKVEYNLAAWCSDVMGEPYHVDHIIPLKGKLVCGLHVEHNLRVIPAKVNQSKNNKLLHDLI